jgi:hypothetical protein
MSVTRRRLSRLRGARSEWPFSLQHYSVALCSITEEFFFVSENHYSDPNALGAERTFAIARINVCFAWYTKAENGKCTSRVLFYGIAGSVEQGYTARQEFS